MILPKVISERQSINSPGSQTMAPSAKGKYLSYVIVLVMCCFDSVISCRGGTLIRTGIQPGEKQQILETHNRLRSSVAQGRVPNQPGAENMREMVWDEELAAKAQQWANQCTFQHDPSRYLDRFTMGQNLAIIWSTIPLADDDGDFPSRIQNWFNEVQKYAWGAQWSPATGHYSQLVWGETNLVGCGFSYYKDSRRFNKLWVCNYGPGGNVVGSVPYEVGRPACANYGMQPSTRYSGLCSDFSGTLPEYNPENNFITQNTYTLKTERFNPPTYQVQNKIKNIFTNPQSAFKSFVQPAAETTAFNVGYPLKTVFNHVRDVFKPQPETVVVDTQHQTDTYNTPQTYNYQTQQQQHQTYDHQSYDQTYQQQQQQPQYQPSYQTPVDHQSTYQQQSTDHQTYNHQQQQTQAYQQQSTTYNETPQTKFHKTIASTIQQPKLRTLDEIRKNAFLTYDWSQLFNTNFRFRAKK